MARKKDLPADTLDELESLGGTLIRWVTENIVPVAGTAGAILVLAAGVGGYRAWSESQANAAAGAMAALRGEYVLAMGGQPNDIEVPEPANPEAARGVRTEFVDRFLALGSEYEGTGPGATALLEAGEIYLDLGAPDRALEVWEQAAAQLPADSALGGIVRTRIARRYEDDGRFADAAREHELAAAIPDYPLSDLALADAARCWVAAAEPGSAIAAYDRLLAQSPDARLPDHVTAQIEELRLQR